MCLLLGAITSILALAAPPGALLPRLLLSLAFALFVPGYLLVCALFPIERDLGHLHRFVLALACSFALIILQSLLLSATPVARSGPAQILSMDALVLALAGAATLRHHTTTADDRLAFTVSFGRSPVWRHPVVPVTAGLAVLLTAAVAIGVAAPADAVSTELAIPVSSGPTIPIQPSGVTVEVRSHEAADATFRVVVTHQGQVLGRSASFTLHPGGRWQSRIATTPPAGNGPVAVDVILTKQGSAVPYRQLRVWMRTIPYRTPS